MVTNYYKVTGYGLGRIEHVFPFGDPISERIAFAAAHDSKTRHDALIPRRALPDGSLPRAARIVVWRRTALHPECPLIGESPVPSPEWTS